MLTHERPDQAIQRRTKASYRTAQFKARSVIKRKRLGLNNRRIQKRNYRVVKTVGEFQA